jgi:hypothetical protein
VNSVKLSITCRQPLEKKYDAKSLALIDAAVARWIAADKARGITTIHVAVDDATAMKRQGASAVDGRITAAKVKTALDALVNRLRPDYIVLVGADDVVPLFVVTNPSAAEDNEPTVPTDNPYASSQPFSSGTRASYLIPDRVVGRIPDLPGTSDPAWLLDYLQSATQWQSTPPASYAKDLLVCADAWKGGGQACATYIGRSGDLLLSPPAVTASSQLRARHGALLQMIKCHGSPGDSQFYGQKGSAYPPVVRSTALRGRTKPQAVIGAMCCYGASVFDPSDPANVHPGEPPIPSVYLRQGAYGFLGSTNTAWVGGPSMMGADWVVASFLRGVLGGASLGRAALEGKQDFLRWIQQQGNDADAADEKTLLQFVLLGDPSIHPVKAASPAGMFSASLLGAEASSGAVMARRARRTARARLGALLRAAAPKVTQVRAGKAPKRLQAMARSLLAASFGGRGVRLTKPRVERVVRRVSAAEPVAAFGPRRAALGVERPNRQYYWTARRESGPVPDIRLVSIQADAKGTVLRTQLLQSS